MGCSRQIGRARRVRGGDVAEGCGAVVAGFGVSVAER
jgi:hypothetical protein